MLVAAAVTAAGALIALAAAPLARDDRAPARGPRRPRTIEPVAVPTPA